MYGLHSCPLQPACDCQKLNTPPTSVGDPLTISPHCPPRNTMQLRKDHEEVFEILTRSDRQDALLMEKSKLQNRGQSAWGPGLEEVVPHRGSSVHSKMRADRTHQQAAQPWQSQASLSAPAMRPKAIAPIPGGGGR